MVLTIQVFASTSISVNPISDAIGITVQSFDSRTISEETVDAFSTYNPKSARAIIIDLRNNNGGYIHEAIEFAALFVNNQSLIDLIDHNNTRLSVTRPNHHPYIQTNALIIIIGPNTASSAEAAAYILNKHPNSIIMGKQSYGKSTIKSQSSSSSPYQSFDIKSPYIIPDIDTLFSDTDEYESQLLHALSLIPE